MEGSSLKRKGTLVGEGGKRTRASSEMVYDDGTIVVGSRKSNLAVIQTTSIIKKLEEKFPDEKFKMHTMETLGDKILNIALPKIGEKSLFTKDLEIALANHKVEFLVHSLKDLPTTLPPDMAIGTIIERDNPYDCVLFHPKFKGKKLADLPPDSVVGTSSLRRIAQLKRKYSNLKFESVRGNLNTRLKKLVDNNDYDALILAKAGVDRMEWTDKIGQILTEEDCYYAIGQGAIAVEIRSDDKNMQKLLGSLTHLETMLRCACERAFMRKLNGGCSTPVGCTSKIESGKLSIEGVVLNNDGSTFLHAALEADIKTEIPSDETKKTYSISKSGIAIDSIYMSELLIAEDVGEKLALELIELGADHVLAEVRANIPKIMNIHIPTKVKK